MEARTPEPEWTDVLSLAELEERSRAVVKARGKQILLWKSGDRIHACNNRCPHEGYPLAEGTLTDGCILTCNWHNWKFDLSSGETIVGGDRLRLYPVRVVDGRISLDLQDPPSGAIRDAALDGLRQAFDEHDYDRMAREIARFERTGADAAEVLPHAFGWGLDRLEYGMTHAQAAAADWLGLRDRLGDGRDADRMVPVLEIVGHLSWDCRTRPGTFPYPDGTAQRYDAARLEDAIEREDQDEAIAQVRAGLAEEGPEVLRPALERAALRHYQNFGHTPIYLEKTYELVDRLGPGAAPALFLALVRTFCTGAREDLIPEFRAYGTALDAWTGTGREIPAAEDFRGKGVAACLGLIAAGGGAPDAMFDVLMEAGCDAMLHFNDDFRDRNDRPVQDNVDWLDFSHAMTHLNAARKICQRQPDLWANALLQTGCFLGRNSGYIDWDRDVNEWRVDGDAESFIEEVLEGMLDHGEPLYIYPAHVLKLATVIREELRRNPDAAWKPVALAALNRFVHEPAKKKHARRTAAQALKFVAAQG